MAWGPRTLRMGWATWLWGTTSCAVTVRTNRGQAHITWWWGGSTISPALGGWSSARLTRLVNSGARSARGAVTTASGSFATVCGGAGNIASGERSAVSGGESNVASGFASSVSGGTNRRAPGTENWAAGPLFADN